MVRPVLRGMGALPQRALGALRKPPHRLTQLCRRSIHQQPSGGFRDKARCARVKGKRWASRNPGRTAAVVAGAAWVGSNVLVGAGVGGADGLREGSPKRSAGQRAVDCTSGAVWGAVSGALNSVARPIAKVFGVAE